MEQTAVKKNRIDWVMIGTALILVIFGLVMIYSASSYEAQMKNGAATFFVKKQLISTAVGVVGMILAAVIPYRFWKSKVSYIVYVATIAMTFLVLTRLGIDVNGARRWIDLNVITLQPAEFLKVGVILCEAALIYRNRNKLGSLKGFAFTVAPSVIAAAVVALVTKDLGTAIVIFVIGIVMMALVAPKKKYIVYLLAFVLAAGVVLILIQPYRMVRIKAWLKPAAYSDKESYQPLQALYAIASGGFFGKGLGKSTQKLGFIPESENDMIFSIICEELGVFGGLCLIALIGLLLWRIWLMYKNTDDIFGKLVMAGIMAHIGFQTFLNIGVVSSLLPNTGVPLPFISYGGSSIMALLVELGLVISIARGGGSPEKTEKKTKKPVLREDKSRGVIYYQ